MDLFNLVPNLLNPVLVSRLDGNVEAAILLVCLDRWVQDKQNEEGWAHFTRTELIRLTGLTNNKIKKSKTFLKKRNIINTRISNGIRLYKVNFRKVEGLSGYKLNASILKKLDNNAKAALLFIYYLEFQNQNRVNLMAIIPSAEIKLTTGMSKNSQIYARDSLLGMNVLEKVGEKEENYYILNKKGIEKKKLVSFES